MMLRPITKMNCSMLTSTARAAVVQRVEAARQNLDQREAQQANSEEDQRLREAARTRSGRSCAVTSKTRGRRLGQHDHDQRRRHRQIGDARIVRMIVSRSRRHSPAATNAASVGKAACETAMPKTPMGSITSVNAVT